MGCFSSKPLAIKKCQAEITSTIQELLLCLPELAPLIVPPAPASPNLDVSITSSGTPAPKKRSIQLQKEIANNLKLLYFIKEYLNNSVPGNKSKMGCFSSKPLSIKEYQTEITSTIQELLLSLLELAPLIVPPAPASPILDLSITTTDTPAPKKRSIQLQKEIANNLKLLYFINEYLKNIVKVVKNVAKIKELESIDEQFRLAIMHQQVMVDRLHIRKLKLKKKMRSVKTWRKGTSRVCEAVCMAALICSFVCEAVGAVPAAGAAVTAVTDMVKLLGKWLDSLLEGRVAAFEAEHEMITEMLAFFTNKTKLSEVNKNSDDLEKLIDFLVKGVTITMAWIFQIILANYV